jgi:hypothetical protein
VQAGYKHQVGSQKCSLLMENFLVLGIKISHNATVNIKYAITIMNLLGNFKFLWFNDYTISIARENCG